MGTVGESPMDCRAPRAVASKELFGLGSEEQLTKQPGGLSRWKYYWHSYTSGIGYCYSEHPACQSSLWSFLGKHCLFYQLIPFFLSGGNSEHRWVRTGVWERDEVSMSAGDPLEFRPGLCCCQSSPGEKGYLTLSIPLSFLCGCDWALTGRMLGQREFWSDPGWSF